MDSSCSPQKNSYFQIPGSMNNFAFQNMCDADTNLFKTFNAAPKNFAENRWFNFQKALCRSCTSRPSVLEAKYQLKTVRGSGMHRSKKFPVLVWFEILP